MATQKQILAAVKKVLAAKTTKTRKKNPAPRMGTAKPKRKSQITGKTPSKRLVKRRKENKVEGYFPNPAAVAKAHRECYYVYVGRYTTYASAEKAAKAFADKLGVKVGIVGD